MSTIIAHLGHAPHIHTSDMLGAVVLTIILYSIAAWCRRPKRVSAARRKALRSIQPMITRKGRK